MKQAVESPRGLTGIRATVVEVDLNGPDVSPTDQNYKSTFLRAIASTSWAESQKGDY